MIPDGIQNCHIFITITRENYNTIDIQLLLSKLMGYTDFRVIGVCGLKDKYALTTQTFSVPTFNRTSKIHVSPNELK